MFRSKQPTNVRCPVATTEAHVGMASWQLEYLAALQQRDQKEKASLDIYNACS